jgi:hypothetical protein
VRSGSRRPFIALATRIIEQPAQHFARPTINVKVFASDVDEAFAHAAAAFRPVGRSTPHTTVRCPGCSPLGQLVSVRFLRGGARLCRPL